METKRNTKPWFVWAPKPGLFLLLLSWLLVIGGLTLAFQIFTTEKVALNFITFGPITLLGFGIIIPVFWTIKQKRSLETLGLTTKKLFLSLILGLLFALIQYYLTIANVILPPTIQLIPLIAMALTVGLFEAVFFRGWIQLRIEESFGIIPAIIIGALFYAFYHVGYGMYIDEILFLFFIGLLYAVAFRLTKNILILWPFFTPSGGFYANIKDGLVLPLEATYGFVLVLAIMVIVILTVAKKSNSPG